ncbi:MAG: cytochrome d ubiquinol oxidase subunit II, partial [Bacteroidales bacterium]
LFLILGFHQTAYYPSVFDLQSSLTIQNSSSNLYTLRVMSYVSLFIPLVIAYVAYVWYRLSKTHMNKEELERDDKENVDLY